tara:strand:+ start:2293 stop:3678 length:1386 start_codon:yes stop_codon:yes gene_type:complete
MSYKEKLKELDAIKATIDNQGKLSEELLKKINYRFRLDWNYYSNNMEGNTLTMRETRTIMVDIITINDKPIKDVMEMRGHDNAITEIMKIGRGELNISESRIRELHKAIMHEENKQEALKIGVWKKVDNYVLNYQDERHDFLPHQEVPEAIHNLINWYSAEKEKIEAKKKDALHPVIHALEFHIRYLSIHPFYDGNGRTARILMNLMLIAHGYPPLIIKTEDKNTYYKYLSDIQTYGGDSELYYEHMIGLLKRSLLLVSDAIDGKDISQPTDIDKKLELLEKELEAVDANQELQKSFGEEVLLEIFDTWFTTLAEKTIPAIQKFNKFFTDNEHAVRVYHHVNFSDETADVVLGKIKKGLDQEANRINFHNFEIQIYGNYRNFKKGGLKTFSCNYQIQIKFENTKYQVFVDQFDALGKDPKLMYENLLHIPLSNNQMDTIVSSLSDAIYDHIDYATKEAGLR